MKRMVLLGLLCGCYTPYQPKGFMGGYQDSRLAPGVYLVEVTGNGYTSGATVGSYATRRGLELCNAEGYPHVRFVDADASVSQTQTPVSYETTTTSYGNTAYSTTQRQGGYAVNRHVLEVKAVCMTQSEFDASQAAMREQMLRR